MRLLRGDPDREFVPRNETERAVCSQIKQMTGCEIARFWTQAEYREAHTDENDIGIDKGCDYIVWAGTRVKNKWFCEGSEFLAIVSGETITVTNNGTWTL